MPETKRVWTEQEIIDLLARSDKAVERALLRLYERQTSYEQSSEITHDANDVGFGAFDAEIFSSFAKQILRGFHLSPKQLEVCRKPFGKKNPIPRIAKYRKQLLEVANA